MHLFAFQEAVPPQAEFAMWLPVAAAVAGGILILVLFFFWLVFRQISRSREMAHLERMKALELGQMTGSTDAEKSQSKSLHNAFWIAFWIGVVVPMATVSSVSSVIINSGIEEFRTILILWIGVAVISVAGIIGATALMISNRR